MIQSIRNMQNAMPIDKNVITIKLIDSNIILTSSIADIVKKFVRSRPIYAVPNHI